MQLRKDYKRIVVKVGASLITLGKLKKINTRYLVSLVEQIADLSKRGEEIILVSSGAIACGMNILHLNSRPSKLSDLQAVASIGQNRLMQLYSNLFKKRGLICAQTLLTWDDFSQRKRYLNAKSTILNLLARKTIPVINENDAVASEEIRFGDNDRLSALVATLVCADLLIILSDVDGLLNKQNELIRVVDEITPQVKILASASEKETSVGGMLTKLEAAKIASDSGIACVVANGRTKDILKKILSKGNPGTIFLPKEKKLIAKKRWIAFGSKPKGKIFVDDGAKEALTKRKKSLLSVGIVKLEGDFNCGEVISILDGQGREFARGLVDCSSGILENVKGKRYHKEIVHCDNLVIL